jgi:hypothetical protein
VSCFIYCYAECRGALFVPKTISQKESTFFQNILTIRTLKGLFSLATFAAFLSAKTPVIEAAILGIWTLNK